MNLLNNALVAGTLIALIACGDGQSNDPGAAEVPDEKAPCTFTYDPDSTTIKWTAFKFTERTGVSGTFLKVAVSGAEASTEKMGVLSSAAFEISTASVDSKDPDRNQKIVEHFFGSMLNTSSITGKVVSINDEEAVLSIEMNGVSKEASLDVAVLGNKVSLAGSIDLAEWNATTSVDSLNTICNDLHTGKDGVSKLWPDVALEISTVLASDCE